MRVLALIVSLSAGIHLSADAAATPGLQPLTAGASGLFLGFFILLSEHRR